MEVAGIVNVDDINGVEALRTTAVVYAQVSERFGLLLNLGPNKTEAVLFFRASQRAKQPPVQERGHSALP